MPRYDPWWIGYSERADKLAAWNPWGQNGNPAGLTSWAAADAYSSVWAQFGLNLLGRRNGQHHGVRVLFDPYAEGHHETLVPMCWRLPLSGPVTTATLYVRVLSAYYQGIPGYYLYHKVGGAQWVSPEDFPAQVYGIAEDDFRPRPVEVAQGYDQTYYAATFGFGQTKRNRADSTHWHMRHTTNRALWSIPTAANQWRSHDVTAVVNEILGRAGWKSGNRLGLVLANEGLYADATAGAPDWNQVWAPDDSLKLDVGANAPYLVTT